LTFNQVVGGSIPP